MSLQQDLQTAWICFREAIRTFCQADNAYQRGLAITEAEVYLRRMRGMVAEIPLSVHPVYVHHLQSFLDSWEADPARMRAGSWDEKEQLLLNSVELESIAVENAIRHVGDEHRQPDPAPAAPWSEPMDRSDIAKAMRRSLRQLRRWENNGKIELKPCGGKWKYRLPEK